MTTTERELPKGLRKSLDRVTKRNKRLEAQCEVLVRMVVHQRLQGGSFDWANAEMILRGYRPEFTNPEDYAEAFTADAIVGWLATGRERR